MKPYLIIGVLLLVAATGYVKGRVDNEAKHTAFAVQEALDAARDAATLPLVRRLASSDPAAAWQWAAAVGDAGLQSDARISATGRRVVRDRQHGQRQRLVLADADRPVGVPARADLDVDLFGLQRGG